MNLITGVNILAQIATVYDLSTGLPIANMPTKGMTYQQAVKLAEKIARQIADDWAWEEEQRARQEAEWAEEQSRWDDEFLASQGMNWQP